MPFSEDEKSILLKKEFINSEIELFDRHNVDFNSLMDLIDELHRDYKHRLGRNVSSNMINFLILTRVSRLVKDGLGHMINDDINNWTKTIRFRKINNGTSSDKSRGGKKRTKNKRKRKTMRQIKRSKPWFSDKK